jgi:hypothetical protein
MHGYRGLTLYPTRLRAKSVLFLQMEAEKKAAEGAGEAADSATVDTTAEEVKEPEEATAGTSNASDADKAHFLSRA